MEEGTEAEPLKQKSEWHTSQKILELK